MVDSVAEQLPIDLVVEESPLGALGAVVRDGKLVAVTFGHKTARRAELALEKHLAGLRSIDAQSASHGRRGVRTTSWRGNQPADAQEIVDRLQQYASGDVVDFSDIELAGENLTPFQQRVVAACRDIPYGATAAYGELARRVGRPGAARAVGAVMATNRLPLVVPCHRVVASSGGLGGFSAPQGVAMKRRLLAMEAESRQLA